MKHPDRLWQVSILVLMLIATEFVMISTFGGNAAAASSQDNLLQYEWPQFMGDSSFSRFSAGPAPDTSAILWKANVTGIQTYISAFDGMVFVGTNTSVAALDKDTGNSFGKQTFQCPELGQ